VTKKRKIGFSYMEMLMALALFVILLAVALPLLAQGGRNLAYSAASYQAHLNAQNIMIAVRGGEHNFAFDGIGEYSVWIHSRDDTVTFHSKNAPVANLLVSGFSSMSVYGDSRVIYVIVWDDSGNPAGRAIGVLK